MATPDARPAGMVLAWSRELVDPALREAVDRLPSSIRKIAGHHLGWWDRHGEPTSAVPGKAIRPALTLLCAQACGAPPEAALDAAVAVELVHNFTLLHDDLMDGDRLRRQRPTAWAVFGPNAALLAGDALLALAVEVLAGSAHPTATRTLTSAVLELVEGEQADLAFEHHPDVDLAACVTMVERKTGSLFGAACELGATFAGAPTSTVADLRRFGRLLGVAFQHVDDLLGIWGESAATGKPARSDLRRRKKTLPVVAALASGTSAGHALSALYGSDEPLDAAALAHVSALIESAGGRTWGQEQAVRLQAEALHHLHTSELNSRATAELTALAALITSRDR